MVQKDIPRKYILRGLKTEVSKGREIDIGRQALIGKISFKYIKKLDHMLAKELPLIINIFI